jgi:hypothetical protein
MVSTVYLRTAVQYWTFSCSICHFKITGLMLMTFSCLESNPEMFKKWWPAAETLCFRQPFKWLFDPCIPTIKVPTHTPFCFWCRTNVKYLITQIHLLTLFIKVRQWNNNQRNDLRVTEYVLASKSNESHKLDAFIRLSNIG